MNDPVRYKVLFDPEALRDFEEIAEYLTLVRGQDDAQELVGDITKRAEALSVFPLRGGTLKELLGMQNCIFRQLVHNQYRIIYAVFETVVMILMVVDGRRDLGPLFRERLGVDPPA